MKDSQEQAPKGTVEFGPELSFHLTSVTLNYPEMIVEIWALKLQALVT